MQRQGILAVPRHLVVLAGLLTTTLLGCQTDDTDPPDGSETQPTSELSAPVTQCVQLGGLQNCALGAAKVVLNKDAATLDVTGLRTAGQDGLTTLLPSTRTFSMAGTSTATARTTEISRAISQGELISTMTAQHDDQGLTLSGTFTGNADATYNANLFKGGKLVGSIPNVRSGEQGLRLYPGPQAPARIIIIIIFWGFDNIDIWIINWLKEHGGESAHAATPQAGACVWKVDLDPTADPHATLPDGSSVAVDHVEMVEDVTSAGSYPYMSFDRIDYSSNAGALHVTGEAAK